MVHKNIQGVVLKGKFVTCESKQGAMNIYLSRPHEKSNGPVVIVLQEAFGVNHHIQSICDRLAEVGFIVAAPELFHRLGKHIEISYTDRDQIMNFLSKLTNQNIIADVREAINFLDRELGINTRNLYSLGFCVGGFASVLSATKLNIQKMVSFYGAGLVHSREGIGTEPILGDLKNIKSQCLFFYGEKDMSIPKEEREQIQKTLKENKVKFKMEVFPDSGHGYFCDERGSFNAEDANKSWAALIQFLKN